MIAATLIAEPGRTQLALGHALGLDKTTVTSLLDRLEADGLIVRSLDPHDRRARIPEITADAVRMGYDGYATLEPHLLGGGPTGGVTGPELFPKAVAAFKRILDQAGAQYS